VIGLGATAAVVAASGASSDPGGLSLTSVPNPNTSSTGYAPPNILSPELSGIVVAQGATRAEYPDPSTVSYYGYDNDKLNPAGQPVMVPAGGLAEAHKTEPDKNTYLVFKHGLAGSDSNYDYGTHFLFQGHESGTPGSITRINLDADAAHRVTVLATKDSSGASIATIDGSTWDPSAKRLLFTTEGASRPTYAATPDYPSTVTDVSGSLGRGGYEGIQNDSAGDIWIVEDVSGDVKAGASFAKRPNSFVYRYTPSHPGDLEHGKLEALQVLNGSGAPITWASQAALNAPDEVALYAYGNTFRTRWVLVHDTASGTAPFNANTLARAAGATPFKRPENGLFRPGSRFREFYFDETGDTNIAGEESSTAGGWGSIMKLTQSSPTASTGTLTMFYKSDEPHAGLDNVAFLSSHQVTFVQDAGDNIHQDFGFDSGYVWDTNVDYSNPSNQPSRWLAEGRDPSATIDADTANTGNETDNEITGTTVERRPDDGRDPRCADPESRRLRLALVLDAAARRQHHVGGARLQPPRPRLGRRQRGRLIAERSYAPSVTTAYIGLGSNLGDREATILAAAERLGPHRLSPIVESEPWGYADQPNFLNAVAEVETALGARALLDFLLEVERELGRVRDGPRYGPRSIDLDLLLFGDEVIDEPGLTVPHPRMAERLFVLEPLLALNPGLFVPGQGALEALVAGLQST